MRVVAVLLSACLIVDPALSHVPCGSDGPIHLFPRFQSEALAALSPWERGLSSRGTRAARAWSSRVAVAALAGVLTTGTVVPRAQTRTRPPDAPIAGNATPRTLNPTTHLFTSVDGYSRVPAMFAAVPWMQPAYVQRVQNLARQNRTVTIPASIPNTSAAERYERIGVALATEFRISGDRAYLDQARRVLQGLAAGFSRSDARVLDNESLDFSIGLVHDLQTYSLIRSELSVPERQALIQNFFFPAGQELMNNPHGNTKSNHWTAVSNALITDGLTLGGPDGLKMLDFGMNNPQGGLLFQLANSVKDGIWWENSFSYHLYALQFLIQSSRALEANAIPFYRRQGSASGASVQTLMETVLRAADANDRLPWWGDGTNTLDLKHEAGALMLIAHAMNPGILGHAVRIATPPTRDDGQTVLMLSIALGQTPPGFNSAVPQPGNVSIPAAGLAFLRLDNSSNFFANPAGQRYVHFVAAPETHNAHANGNQLTWSFSVGGAESSFQVTGSANEGSIDTRAGNEKIFRERRGLGPTVLINDQDQKGSLPYINPDSTARLAPIDDHTVEGFTSDAFDLPVDYHRQLRLTEDGNVIDFVEVRPRTSSVRSARLVVHGPLGANLVRSNVPLKESPRLPGEVFDTLTAWQTGQSNAIQGPVDLVWQAANGGSRVVVAEVPGAATTLHLVEGTPVATQKQPIALLAHSDGSGSFVSVYMPFAAGQQAQAAQWKVERLASNQTRAEGVWMKGRENEQWHIAVLGARARATLTHTGESGGSVSVDGKTADITVRPARHVIEAQGRITQFSLPEPPEGITAVMLNGTPAAFERERGRIILKPQSGWSTLSGLSGLWALLSLPFLRKIKSMPSLFAQAA